MRAERRATGVVLSALLSVLMLSSVVVIGPGSAAAHAGTDSACPWVRSTDPVEARVAALLGEMTVDDKLQMVHGIGPAAAPYAGVIAGNDRLCIPRLVFSDGPAGVANTLTGVTQLPAPIAAASTWDPELVQQYGAVIGREANGKGINVNLGPTVNLVRDPRWGRAFETYGEDPHLAARLAVAYVDGVQGEGTMAQIKHYAVYNQETNRNLPADNAVVSERPLQELYLRQFQTAVGDAAPSSVMCSYSTVNGVHACENAALLNELKTGWQFPGFVTSDWFATQSAAAAANAGLDVEMPSGLEFGQPLREAVDRGEVPVERIDDMVRRVLTQMFRFGLFDGGPAIGSSDATVTNSVHARVARRVAEQGTVLLKNADDVLPLDSGSTQSIAVIGADADAAALTNGGGSAAVRADSVSTPKDAVAARARRSDIEVRYAQGNIDPNSPLPAIPASALPSGLDAQFFANAELAGAPVATSHAGSGDILWNGQPPAPGVVPEGWSARYTGTLVPPVTGAYSFVLDSHDVLASVLRLRVDGRTIIDSGRSTIRSPMAAIELEGGHPVEIQLEYGEAGSAFTTGVSIGWNVPDGALQDEAVALAKRSDVAVVFASQYTSEDADLLDIDLLADVNRVIAAVARANPRTIVVLNTGSAVTMPWAPQVEGIVEAWYPGQGDGRAIASVLFGDVNPSGKLPVTFPKSLEQVPAVRPEQFPGADGAVQYSEGGLIGYRWYQSEDVRPRFAFGSGLSYTSFSIDDPEIDVSGRGDTTNVTLHATATNTGDRAGAEVVQVYVRAPASVGAPPRQLQAFARVRLGPDESRRVELTLDHHAFEHWDETASAWTLEPGTYEVLVGDASDRLPIRERVRVR